MSRLLVTGANGFIGRRALPLLMKAGHELYAVSSRAQHSRPGASEADIRWEEADLRDPGSAVTLMERIRPERLLHLAWCTEHPAFWSSAENVVWVEATLRLLRAFAACGGRRAVCAGTCAEYVWNNEPCVEGDTPLEPSTLYGLAKDATRRVASGLAEISEFDLAWGRVFFVYGPGEATGRVVPTVARALLSGRPTELTDGRQIRDLLHVDDVAGGFAALMDSEVDGAINISAGHGVALREVAELIGQAIGRAELVRFGAVQRGPGDPDLLIGMNHRLVSEVGFRPSVGLERGIADAVAWWRTQDQAG